MHALLLTTILGLSLDRPVATDRADIVEVNHYYDEQGSLVFDQMIFWDWCDNTCTFRCFAWRFIKSPLLAPRRDYQRGGYVTIWQDGEELRQVRSTTSFESWTQFDPEVHDRQFVAQSRRRGLFGRRTFKAPAAVVNNPGH